MTTFLFLVALTCFGMAIFMYIAKNAADIRLAKREKEVAELQTKVDATVAQLQVAREEELRQLDTAMAQLQSVYEEKLKYLDEQKEFHRQHYETETRKALQEAKFEVDQLRSELNSLRPYAEYRDAEAQVKQTLVEAISEAAALREEATGVLTAAKSASLQERVEAQERAKEILRRAQAVLEQTHKDTARLVSKAEQTAFEINGDAYKALRERQDNEEALVSIRNIIGGYGDRYVVPTHSLLDDLAADFGHVAAGESLRLAREVSKRMVEEGAAAACDYPEEERRSFAARFVIDAFNGRVDAILSTVRHNNYGTLDQQIRDVFNLVNLNGQAFRNARILPGYLQARLDELKWGVIVQELRQKEREEQRQIQEQIREEEKARRDYERAVLEAAREEVAIKQAMEKARREALMASADERAALEAQLASLNVKLTEAEAKNQRALSMAQQTRAGHVYIISNIGSFGDEVFKIGMTRRLDPMDRVKELGDASVPFEFDVHAMIYSEDAPALERMLHERFDVSRINRVNYRKEFFRIPLGAVREFVTEKGLEATFTLAAEAREYRETLALLQMPKEEQQKYQLQDFPEEAAA